MTTTHPDLPTFWNAVEGGHEATVNLLLNDEKIQIPVNAPDVYGKSAFLIAASYGRITIMRTLIHAGADIHALDNYKANAITLAAEANHAEAVRLLIEMGVDCRKPDVFGQQAIHRACKKGHAGAVRALIQAGGVDPDEHDSRGQTPKQLAEEGHFFDLQQLIKSALVQKRKAAKALKKQQEAAAAAAAASAGGGGGGRETGPAAAAAASSGENATSPSTSNGSSSSLPKNLSEAKLSNSELSALGSQAQTPTNVGAAVAAVSSEMQRIASGTVFASSAEKAPVAHNKDEAPSSSSSSTAPRQQQAVSPGMAALLRSVSSASSSMGSNVSTAGGSVAGGNNNSSFGGNSSFSSSMGAPSVSNQCIFHPDVQVQVDALLARVRQFFPNYLIIDFKDIQLKRKLGGGGGGTVFEALIKSTDRPVAAKLFRDAEEGLEQAVNECQLQSILHHKNIIGLVGVSVAGSMWPTPQAEMMMLMDMGCSTLQSLLSEHTEDGDPESDKFSSFFTWERVIRCLWQIAAGLEYLHAHQPHAIYHLDLKPPNIICTDESPLDGLSALKLCDFGITRKNVSESTQHVEVSHVGLGTVRWAAPEQLFTSRVGAEADTYSFGAIGFWLMSGQMPWREAETQSHMDIRECQMRGRLFLRDTFKPRKGCPNFLSELVVSCLDPEPSKRPKDGSALLELLRQGAAELVSSGGSGSLSEQRSPTLDMTYMSSHVDTFAAAAAAAGGDVTEQIVGVEPSNTW